MLVYRTTAPTHKLNVVGTINVTQNAIFEKNVSVKDNQYLCLGSSGCADSYIMFNGSSMIIKVN